MPEVLTFLPLDVYTAKARHFQIIDGKLMPALNTIEGLGDKAAEASRRCCKTGSIPVKR